VSTKRGMTKPAYDAVVVGAGPNGMAAAIVLAQRGLSTLLVEADSVVGGGMRSSELTLPGCVHDVCSAVHPLGIASPFFRSLPLEQHGLTWLHSQAPLAHVFSDGSVTLLERSIEATAAQLGDDGPAYRALLSPFVDNFEELLPMVLAPLRVPPSPLLMARFGLSAVRSMRGLARSHFRGQRAPALLAGIAAHAMVPLESLVTSSFALVLAMAGHAVGWPVARGGSQAIANALLAHYRALGGELALDTRVSSLSDLPTARAYLLDLSPVQLLSIAGSSLPPMYRRRVARFRYGPGVFKVDWTLREPIPWKDARASRAVTVHLSGTLEQVAAAEAAVNAGKLPERPFVLLGQPSLVDDTRAPSGKHTVWAYCHVPHGSPVDALPNIEAEVERNAPGFRDLILQRATRNAVELSQHSPNYVGGDISGGVSDLTQLFFRPVLRVDPYSTPDERVFLCSSSTPPGGGVHGMCGYWAAQSALHKVFKHAPQPTSAARVPTGGGHQRHTVLDE
jgi:phytoene dehydrogenase-like protein